MITIESDGPPSLFQFDVAIVAVGYEKRCSWVVSQYGVSTGLGLGLTFGFLEGGSYLPNRTFFFAERGYVEVSGIAGDAVAKIVEALRSAPQWSNGRLRVFVDISSMSREMIANVALSLEKSRDGRELDIFIAYSPSKFSGPGTPAPIRVVRPIKPELAGWSSRPEMPLAVIAGLGCEPGLALGALQFLEPDRAWIYRPKGVDEAYDREMEKSNEHIQDIFDVTMFDYDITTPSVLRGRHEVLLKSIAPDFRIISIPFGPKIFAWSMISTVVFESMDNVGIWNFSSREQGALIDRAAEGQVVWYRSLVEKLPSSD